MKQLLILLTLFAFIGFSMEVQSAPPDYQKTCLYETAQTPIQINKNVAVISYDIIKPSFEYKSYTKINNLYKTEKVHLQTNYTALLRLGEIEKFTDTKRLKRNLSYTELGYNIGYSKKSTNIFTTY